MPIVAMPTVRRSLRIPCEHGVHLRVASRLVERAQTFKSHIWLSANGTHVDAKSILGLLHLGAGKGTVVVITAYGSDANEAVGAVGEVFTDHPHPCGPPPPAAS